MKLNLPFSGGEKTSEPQRPLKTRLAKKLAVASALGLSGAIASCGGNVVVDTNQTNPYGPDHDAGLEGQGGSGGSLDAGTDAMNDAATDAGNDVFECAGLTGLTATPNVFDPNQQETTISYTLMKPSNVQVFIKDQFKNIRRTLQNNVQKIAGAHSINWNGRDDGNNLLPNGQYIASVEAKDSGCTISDDIPVTIAIAPADGGTDAGPDGSMGCSLGGIDPYGGIYANPSAINPTLNQKSALHYHLTGDTEVGVVIVDDNQVFVRNLQTQVYEPAGSYSVIWDGRDFNGNIVASGHYNFQVNNSQAGNCSVMAGGGIIVDNAGNEGSPAGNAAPDCSGLNISVDPTPASQVIPAGTSNAKFACYSLTAGCQDISLLGFDGQVYGIGASPSTFLSNVQLLDGTNVLSQGNIQPGTNIFGSNSLSYSIPAYQTRTLCQTADVSASTPAGSQYGFEIPSPKFIGANIFSGPYGFVLDNQEFGGNFPAQGPLMTVTP